MPVVSDKSDPSDLSDLSDLSDPSDLSDEPNQQPMSSSDDILLDKGVSGR